MTRGGHRPGAGRPRTSPSGERRERVVIYLPPSAVVRLSALANGRSPGAVIEELLTEAPRE